MTAQQSEESSTTRWVLFQQVVITSSVQRFKPKLLPKDTAVAVDKNKFYFGSYTTAWKDVDMMLLDEGGFNFKDTKEHRLMECKGPRGSQDYKAFQQFVQRKWQKQQTKKDRELARERSSLPKARPKPTKAYGRNRKTSTQLTTSWGTRDDSEDDDDGGTFNTKQTWKQKLQHKKELEEQTSFGMEEPEDNDPVATIVDVEEDKGENVPSDTEEDVTDDVQVPEEPEHPFTSTKTPKPKGRVLRKKLGKRATKVDAKEDDSDDDELFGDPKLTTPAAEAQVVTPAERQSRNGDETTETDTDTETVAAASCIKPKQGTLDAFFQPNRNSKAPGHSTGSQREAVVEHDSSDKRALATSAIRKKSVPVSPKNTTLTDSPQAPFPPASPRTAKLTASPLGSFVSSNLLSPKATTAPTTTTNSNLTPPDSRTTIPKAPPTTWSKSRATKRCVRDIPDLSDDDNVEFGPSPSSSEPKINDSLSALPPPSNKRKLPCRPLQRKLRPRISLLGRSDNSPSDNNTRRPPWRDESKTEMTSDSDDCPYRGLQNTGNSCYLNSSLQMLFTVKQFVDCIQGKGRDLVESVVSTAREVADMTKSFAARANAVKAALDKKTDKFRGTRQHDAHELVGELIDKIHEELEEERNERQKQQDESKPISNATTDDGKPKATTTETSPPGGVAGIDNAEAMSIPATEPTNASQSKETDKDGDGFGNVSIEAADRMALEEESTSSVSTPTLEQADDDCFSGELAWNKTSADAPTENEATNDELPTDEFFRCDIEVCLKCKTCGYSRTKTEMYRHLSLDIEHHEDNDDTAIVCVKKCLERFFQEEEREIKCEKCENGETASQTLRLLNRPKALLLHLKRFIVAQRKCDDGSLDITMRKNKAQVGLSKRIALDSFRGKGHDWKAVEESQYSLRSLVYHVGDRASSGHYTAHAMRSRSCEDGSGGPREWVSFDDSKTETADFERFASSTFEQRNAYMLLYMLE